MATFVYLFQADEQKQIQKDGIKQNNVHNPVEKGVFCMPVTKDFYATHQWARELMRIFVFLTHRKSEE